MIFRPAVLAAFVAAVAALAWSGPSRGPAAGPRWAETRVDPPPPVTDELRSRGERLYGWNCLPCHGAEGKGDGPVADRLALRPRDYTRGLFKLKTSGDGEMPFDEDLYRTITTGIAASGMPSFGTFEPIERWALVAHVKSLAERTLEDGEVIRFFDRFPARTKAALPEGPEAGDPGRGARLFRGRAQCATCHGRRGKGDGPSAGVLADGLGRPVRIPDLTRGEVTFLAGDRPEDVFRVLTLGLPGSPMPSFGSLPVRDRWDLAHFVASIYEEIPEGERVYLRSGCSSCHTLGRGRLIGPDLVGVTRRRPPDWLRRWLRDPPGMLLDESVRAEFRDYPTPMPNLGLSDRDIELLIRFLAGREGAR